MLTLKNIKKIYKSGNLISEVLHDVNLNFEKNEFVTILGPSGSGKTTLLNIIGGLDCYTKGDLIINGKSTKRFTNENWDSYRNSCVGFIFQDYNLIEHISVYKNVELSLTLSGIKNKKKLVLDALNKVGLEKHMHKKPHELSGGQMQRVAIARALVNDPDIILADEPTGALDSKTSIQIMKIIKEISKNKLVIMVSHNEKLARKYSSRIIKIKDGIVTSDSNVVVGSKKSENFIMKKTKMSFITAIILSLNNIKTKRVRSALTSLAASVGIIGIALILSITNGFKKQIDNYEKDTISLFPIVIANKTKQISDEKVKSNNLSSTSKNNKLQVYDFQNKSEFFENKITPEYLNHIEKINKRYLNNISYFRVNKFNMVTFNGTNYNEVNDNINFIELPSAFKEESYIREKYDLLKGNYPLKSDEVVLIVDDKNRIDKNLLSFLIANFKDEVDFNDVIGKELKLINNDDFYKRVTDDVFVKNNINKDLYENKNNKVIKIVGILKNKNDSDMNGIDDLNNVSKIGYLKGLVDDVVNSNLNSAIIKSQINSSGVVFMGGISFETAGITKEMSLTMLGKDDIPSTIYIYPKDFNSKEKIINHLNLYNVGKMVPEKILYDDYAKEMGDLSKSIVDAIAIVLIAFCSISLVVSSIMIGIITYVSVVERTKEIGILRSLGARKKDILRVFNAEAFIIGALSGIFGIGISKFLLIFVNKILYDLTGLENVALLKYHHAFLLVTLSIILTLISAFIPSLIASKKEPVKALKSN